MKSFFVAILLATLLFRIEPAAALAVDHDSTYANADGTSKFADPDDQLSGSQFGAVQLGNQSSGGASSNNGSVTFGFSTIDVQTGSLPGFPLQSCGLGTHCSK